jgi:hypothetical protein
MDEDRSRKGLSHSFKKVAEKHQFVCVALVYQSASQFSAEQRSLWEVKKIEE